MRALFDRIHSSLAANLLTSRRMATHLMSQKFAYLSIGGSLEGILCFPNSNGEVATEQASHRQRPPNHFIQLAHKRPTVTCRLPRLRRPTKTRNSLAAISLAGRTSRKLRLNLRHPRRRSKENAPIARPFRTKSVSKHNGPAYVSFEIGGTIPLNGSSPAFMRYITHYSVIVGSLTV
jgi:hypothetical protein